MVVQDPHAGRVLAMVGGFDSRRSQFSRASQAQRQPGSAFKPFVYASALDNGMTPASMIVDGPFCVMQSKALGQKCFRNFSGGYAGPQTMRWGLEQSRRSEEHTSELQSLMRISYAVFCLKKKNKHHY